MAAGLARGKQEFVSHPFFARGWEQRMAQSVNSGKVHLSLQLILVGPIVIALEAWYWSRQAAGVP